MHKPTAVPDQLFAKEDGPGHYSENLFVLQKTGNTNQIVYTVDLMTSCGKEFLKNVLRLLIVAT